MNIQIHTPYYADCEWIVSFYLKSGKDEQLFKKMGVIHCTSREYDPKVRAVEQIREAIDILLGDLDKQIKSKMILVNLGSGKVESHELRSNWRIV